MAWTENVMAWMVYSHGADCEYGEVCMIMHLAAAVEGQFELGRHWSARTSTQIVTQMEITAFPVHVARSGGQYAWGAWVLPRPKRSQLCNVRGALPRG